MIWQTATVVVQVVMGLTSESIMSCLPDKISANPMMGECISTSLTGYVY